MEESKNLFSLFEHNACTDRALESRVIVADVLAKFERYLILSLGSAVTCFSCVADQRTKSSYRNHQ